MAPSTSYSSKTGCAHLRVERIAEASAVTAAFAASPMKLLTPRSRGPSVWAYTSSFGGGFVAGDQTELDIAVGAGARCLIGTQASTKIYRNPAALPCGHRTAAELEEDALLILAPDPVQAFANSSYTQRQEFHLAATASLVLLDWYTAGRVARGERWELDYFHSRNDVLVDDRRVFADSLLLDPADGPLTGLHRLNRFNCVATLLFLGPAVAGAATKALEHTVGIAVEKNSPTITSASRFGQGVVIRIAGDSAESVGRIIHQHLQPLTDLLADDPWARKW